MFELITPVDENVIRASSQCLYSSLIHRFLRSQRALDPDTGPKLAKGYPETDRAMEVLRVCVELICVVSVWRIHID